MRKANQINSEELEKWKRGGAGEICLYAIQMFGWPELLFMVNFQASTESRYIHQKYVKGCFFERSVG
jgi:hypothetical protein